MTLTTDKAIQIFANLIKDPYFQKTRNKSREEVVWEEAKQRARQAHNNDMALSMAASDDEFGAVKSFLAFMQKAEEIRFDAKSRKKIANLPDEEHARIKGLYAVAQDTDNPDKAAGAKKLLLEIAAQNPNLIPTRAVAEPKKEAPVPTPTKTREPVKQAEMGKIEPHEVDEDAQTPEQLLAEIEKIKAAMNVQMGGKDEKGQVLPAQLTQSGKKVSDLAQAPRIPQTATGKAINMGRFGIADEFSKVSVKDATGKPIYYINPDTNEPEVDKDTGEKIPVLLDVPIYNTLDTTGHTRHPLDAHISKLQKDSANVRASLRAFAIDRNEHPSSLQAASAAEIGGNKWQGFRAYIDDISSRDAYDDSASDAMNKMESALRLFNQVSNLQSKKKVRNIDRKHGRQQTDNEYIKSLYEALDAYDDSVRVLEDEYGKNEALQVPESDKTIFRKSFFPPEQSAELARLWFVQQYAKSQNMFNQDGSEITPFTDFLSRFRFAPEEYMTDKDGLVNGQEPNEHQANDIKRVKETSDNDRTASVHWGKDELTQGLITDIVHQYQTSIGKDNFLWQHLHEDINRWAPNSGLVLNEQGKYTRPRKKTGINKSLWVDAVDNLITDKRKMYDESAKEYRRNKPAAQQKKREQGDVVKQKFVQTFKKLNKVQATDPDDVDVRVSEPVVESYPSMWTALNKEVDDAVQNMPGKDYEEQIENYMEARQQEILQNIEGGLDDEFHPVYELMNQMKLPGAWPLHKRLSATSDPDRVDLGVLQKEPDITKRLDKIQATNAYKQWDNKTDDLYTAMEKLLVDEEGNPLPEASADDLLSPALKERYAQSTSDTNMLNAGIEAYNFIYRHLSPEVKPKLKDDQGRDIKHPDAFIPEFNLGRVDVTHDDGKKGFKNVNYKIEAFGPDDFSTVDDILEKWWTPLVEATAGGGIANRIQAMSEWHDQWQNDLKLQIVKPSKRADKAQLAQEEDVEAIEAGLGRADGEYDADSEVNMVNEYISDDDEDDEKSADELADDEQLRKNLQRMYEAIQDDAELAQEFCGTNQDGENTGAPAAFTVDENGIVQFHPTNFRFNNADAIKKLEGLLDDVGLDGIEIGFTGAAKGLAYQQASKKITASALNTIMKDRFTDEERNLLADTQAPGLHDTYKNIINQVLKMPDQAKLGVDNFIAQIVTPLLAEATDGIVGKYDMGEGEYVEALPPLARDASPEERQMYTARKRTALESINDSQAMLWARQVGAFNGLSHYNTADAEEIAPILFEAIRAGGMERQQAFDELYGTSFDDQGNALEYSPEAFYEDDNGESQLRVWDGLDIDEWIATSSEYGVFVNQLKQMFLDRTGGTGKLRKNIESLVPDWAENITKQFMSPNSLDEQDLFPDVTLYDMGEDADTPPELLSHIVDELNNVQGGLQGFRRISPNAGMLLSHNIFAGRGQSKDNWYHEVDNQAHIDQWKDIFGQDVFNTWRGHRRILSFLGHVNDVVQKARQSGIEMPSDFPDIFQTVRGVVKVHPDIFGRLADDVLSIPQSSKEWEDYDQIPESDSLLRGALDAGYNEDVLADILFGANSHAVPDYTGTRLSTRDMYTPNRLTTQYFDLIGPLTEMAFEGLGRTTAASIKHGNIQGFESDEILAETLSDFSEKTREAFEEKLATQQYSSDLGTPFASKSLSQVDDYVSKLLQTLQEQIDLVPEGSRLRSLVETQGGKPGTLVTRMNQIKKEYLSGNTRETYRKAYWDAMRNNPTIAEATRNSLADKWENLEFSYDDSVKLNTIASMSRALNSYGYDSPQELEGLDAGKRNEINNLRETMNALKDRISSINVSDFDMAANPNYLDNLQMGVADAFTDEENEIPAFQNLNQMTSDLIGNAWTSFNQNFPDQTIMKGDVVIPEHLMNYLKSEYELDETGAPIPELDDKGQPLTETIKDEETGVETQQPVFKEKPTRVDDDASGDPEHPNYLKGMEPLEKWAFTSRHYGDYTEPMKRIQEREMFLQEEEERRAALNRRVKAVSTGQEEEPDTLEGLKAGVQQIKASKKKKTKAELASEQADAQDAVVNPYPGTTEGVEGTSSHPRTHAELMEHLTGPLRGRKHNVLHTDHAEYNADTKPYLSPDAHRHLLNAKLVTPYDSPETKRWEYTEKGKQLMDNLPKVQGAQAYKTGGIMPVTWAEAISGSVNRHGDAFFNTINAAPVETPTPPQPEIEEGGAEPIQNMMYKMARKPQKRVKHTDADMHPTQENHDALYALLQEGVPGLNKTKFKAWIKEHGLLSKGGFIETPFAPNAHSKNRLGIEHLDYRSIMPFDYDEDGDVSGVGGGASSYSGLLSVLYGAEEHFTRAIEKVNVEGNETASAPLLNHLAYKQAVNNAWIQMLHNNIEAAREHPNNMFPDPDDAEGRPGVPIDVKSIIANQYYHDAENHDEVHMNKLRGNLLRWLGGDVEDGYEGYHLESEDGKNYRIFSPQEEDESYEDWVARRGEGTPLDVAKMADHIKSYTGEDGEPLYYGTEGGFNFAKISKQRPIHNDLRWELRNMHGLEHPEILPSDEDDDDEGTGEVIASGPGPDASKEEVDTTEDETGTDDQVVDDQVVDETVDDVDEEEEAAPSRLSFREQKIAQHLQDRGLSAEEAEEYIANLDDGESKKIFGQHLDERLKSTPDTSPAMGDDKRQQYEQEMREHSQEMHGTDIHGASKFSEMNDKQLTDAFHQSHKDISTHRSKTAAEEKQNFANDVVTRVPPLQADATPDTIMDRARVLMSEYLHHRQAYDKPALAHWQAQMQDMQMRASQAGLNWETQLGEEMEQFDGQEGRAMFGSPEHKAFVLQQMQGQQQQQQAQQEEQTAYDSSLDDRFAEASQHEDYKPGEFIKPMIRNDGSRTYVTHDYNNPFTGNQMSSYAANDPAVQDIMAGGEMDSFTDVDGNSVAGWHHPASGSTVHPHVFEKLRSEVKSLNRNPDINTGLYIPDGSRYTNLYDPAPDEEIPAEHSLGRGSFWMGQDGNLIRLDRQADEFDAHPNNAQHDHAPHKVVSDWHTRRIKQHLQQAGEGAEDQFNKRVAPISTPKSERAQQALVASQTPPQRPEKAIDRFRQRQEGLAPQPSFNPMDYMTNREKKKQQVYAATDKLQLPALSGLARFVTREKPIDTYHTEQRQAYEKENKVNELYQKLRSGYYGVDYINAPEEAQKRNPYATPPDVYYGSTPDAQARAAYERQQMQGTQPQPVAQGAGMEQGQAPQERQVQFNAPPLDLPRHWETNE